jgi:hypothetical protein
MEACIKISRDPINYARGLLRVSPQRTTHRSGNIWHIPVIMQFFFENILQETLRT